jgi:hypothetical protein
LQIESMQIRDVVVTADPTTTATKQPETRQERFLRFWH